MDLRGYVRGEAERIEVVVTGERRTILGISATIVRDTVTVNGEVVEDTFDWYAQDRDGNVWYLGEAVQRLSRTAPSSAPPAPGRRVSTGRTPASS